jgi:hypothetical protein
MNVAGPRRPITRLAAMPGRTRISLLSCVLALAIAGCGSSNDGTIPPSDAENLLTLLSAVQTEAAQGECELARDHAQEFVSAVGNLPPDVDPKVADELDTAATNLDQLAKDPSECTETGASGALGDQSTTSTTTTVAPETTTEETTTTEESTTTLEPPTGQQGEPNPPAGGQDQGGSAGGDTGGPASGGVTGGGSAG